MPIISPAGVSEVSLGFAFGERRFSQVDFFFGEMVFLRVVRVISALLFQQSLQRVFFILLPVGLPEPVQFVFILNLQPEFSADAEDVGEFQRQVEVDFPAAGHQGTEVAFVNAEVVGEFLPGYAVDVEDFLDEMAGV